MEESDEHGSRVLRSAQRMSIERTSDLEINALIRGSSVVIQKSIREGFGLTVIKALWKEKPIMAER